MVIYKDIGHSPEFVLEKMVECLHASIQEEKRAAYSAESSA